MLLFEELRVDGSGELFLGELRVGVSGELLRERIGELRVGSGELF
jgi:hypothetical protein